MPEVLLRVNGKEWAGWKSYRIQLGMRQLAGQFELSLTERWAGQDARREIPEGASCEVFYDGELLVTGYIDAVMPSYDAQQHEVTVTGRDKTADLVDCSAPPTQFIGRGLAAVARELCAPFGINVIDQASANAPFVSLKPNDGESVFDVLRQAAEIRGVLLVTDGKGNLLITRAGQERADDGLLLGDNILSASGNRDYREVYSTYTLKGQQQGDDDWFGESVSAVTATARDTRLRRHRPLTIIADGPVDAASARTRVDWERNSRWGNSQSVTYTLTGHRQSSGALWRHGLLVNVTDAYQYLNSAERLIVDATYSLDDQGERVELVVQPREALDVLPTPEPEVTDDWSWP